MNTKHYAMKVTTKAILNFYMIQEIDESKNSNNIHIPVLETLLLP